LVTTEIKFREDLGLIQRSAEIKGSEIYVCKLSEILKIIWKTVSSSKKIIGDITTVSKISKQRNAMEIQ
jgi:hypothetical protein